MEAARVISVPKLTKFTKLEFPGSVHAGFNQAWTEPGNSNLVNLVNFGTEITRAASITSDPLPGSGVSPVANDTSVQVGTVGGVAVFATFNDKAAASEAVPDTGTTCSLLALSLIGLAFLRRKLC